jgi:hypothetical protein
VNFFRVWLVENNQKRNEDCLSAAASPDFEKIGIHRYYQWIQKIEIRRLLLTYGKCSEIPRGVSPFQFGWAAEKKALMQSDRFQSK